MTTTAAAPHTAAHALRCPKCADEMVTYERSGVVVDQCRDCRGIFLDHGELERLVDAESGGAGWTGPQMAAPAPYPLSRGDDGASAGRAMDPHQHLGYRSEWRDHDDH
ncbi:MAG: zf-TFIIB domain-containing protein [Candidatus Limnocylindrales bacterium]